MEASGLRFFKDIQCWGGGTLAHENPELGALPFLRKDIYTGTYFIFSTSDGAVRKAQTNDELPLVLVKVRRKGLFSISKDCHFNLSNIQIQSWVLWLSHWDCLGRISAHTLVYINLPLVDFQSSFSRNSPWVPVRTTGVMSNEIARLL
jgi:hypothetical protein